MRRFTVLLFTLFLCLSIFAVVSIMVLHLQTNGVWDIAELIRSDEDIPAVWISDSQHHFHFIGHDTEAYSDVIQILNELRISRKSIEKYTFGDSSHMIVLEGLTDHTVQYFLFNEDFTKVWVVDNSWISDHSEVTQYEEMCPVFRIKNPRKIRRTLKKICESDRKYN